MRRTLWICLIAILSFIVQPFASAKSWALGAESHAATLGAQHSAASTLQGEDVGGGWHVQYQAPPGGAVDLLAVSAPDATHVYAVGASGPTGCGLGCPGVILRSLDGGATWVDHTHVMPTLALLLGLPRRDLGGQQPDWDDLVAQAASETDATKRKDQFSQIQKLALPDMPEAPISEPTTGCADSTSTYRTGTIIPGSMLSHRPPL